MHRISALAVVLLTCSGLFAQPSPGADQIWSQEQAYWKYVQDNNLEEYRNLWHPDFLGWPSVSPEPVRKAHITDWITVHTGKGETLKACDLERLIIQVKGNYATSTYRVRGAWAGKDDAGQSFSTRVIHTWLRQPDGKWQIISGMSAPTNAEGR